MSSPIKTETTTFLSEIASITGLVPLVVADCAADFPGKSSLVAIYSKSANMIVAEKVPRLLALIFVNAFNARYHVEA